MARHIPIIILMIAAMSLLMGCSESGPTITDDGVLVATNQLDVQFTRLGSFSGTYMIFGGTVMNHGDAFSKVHLAGLDAGIARAIHADYPDFQKCKSPGAPLAQREIRDFDIVPGDSKVMKTLKKTLSLHEKSLGKDGGGVCVEIKGEILSLRSVVVRELDEDITSTLPPQVYHEYFLVQSAKILDFESVMTARSW